MEWTTICTLILPLVLEEWTYDLIQSPIGFFWSPSYNIISVKPLVEKHIHKRKEVAYSIFGQLELFQKSVPLDVALELTFLKLLLLCFLMLMIPPSTCYPLDLSPAALSFKQWYLLISLGMPTAHWHSFYSLEQFLFTPKTIRFYSKDGLGILSEVTRLYDLSCRSIPVS